MRGLTAAELAPILVALNDQLLGRTIRDVAKVGPDEDLLLFVNPLPAEDARPGYCALQVAFGAARARIALTERRFRRPEFHPSPQVDALNATLADAEITGVVGFPGDRRARLELLSAQDATPPAARLALEVELFGPGLWTLRRLDPSDDKHAVLELSRPVRTKSRVLQRGGAWSPPPESVRAVDSDSSADTSTAESRLKLLQAADARYSARDLAHESESRIAKLRAALHRASRQAEGQLTGLLKQENERQRAGEIRGDADLLLAYAHTAKPGDQTLEVPDFAADDDSTRTIAIPPGRSATTQAKALYERARKLEDGAEVAAKRRELLAARLTQITSLRERLEVLATADPQPAPRPTQRKRKDAELPPLDQLEQELREQGFITKRQSDARGGQARSGGASKSKTPKAGTKRGREAGFRRFTSAEGYPIFCGRTNQENDRLSVRVAKGNDLWFHVGEQRAGSHVVVRVPKGKTASLETQLDAGTIAVHFSKARGLPRAEVIYCFAKHVRKPKKSPPGSVVPGQTKTLVVRLDEARLKRLLDQLGDDASARGKS